MIPGNNILNTALSVLGKQTVYWSKFASRETNEIGLDVSVYKTPYPISGSFQPIARRQYQQYGLDFNKNYALFYAPQDLMDIARDTSGDKVFYNSREWQCLGLNDWFVIDGWVAMLLVETGKTQGAYCA